MQYLKRKKIPCFSPSSATQQRADGCVDGAKDQDPINRCLLWSAAWTVAVAVAVACWRSCLLLAPQWLAEWYFPPHLFFVVSPRRDDLYYLGCEIKEGFLTVIP